MNISGASKPILMNGFPLTEGVEIKKRVDRFFFTEVYELSNDKCLYLFLKLKGDDILEDKRQAYNFIEIESADEKYPAIILDEYSRKHISILIKDLTTRKGFADVAGMEDLKKMLRDEVISPLQNPEKFKKFGVSIPNGLILYGPPGTGKTFIVRKLAEEMNYEFLEVKHSDISSPYIHETVKKIGEVFEKAAKAAPAILFFDEINGLIPDRREASTKGHKQEEINEFLVRLHDAGDNKVFVVGATNYLESIDEAALRPGRFDKKVYVGLPDEEARKGLFKIGLRDRPSQDIDYDKLSKLTDKFSAAEIIEGVVENAARAAAIEDKDAITQDMLEQGIDNIKKDRPKPPGTVGF